MRSTLPAFNEIWQRKFRARLLAEQEQSFKESTFLVGCSGGMDSMLLLQLMAVLFPKRVRAIYIDHQLQAASADWGQFVKAYTKQLGIELLIQPVRVASGNLENQARTARYQAFKQHLNTKDVLVLAHHQQDQAETVFLRLLSGSGVSGLSAMQERQNNQGFDLWRPLLSLSREQIETWAEQLQIEFVQDQTNFDIHYDRAWCRQEVWPLLKSRYPKMQEAIARTSLLMQDAKQILAEVLTDDLQTCVQDEKLDLACLEQLSLPRQRQLLSAWMKGQDQYRPSFEMVERLKQEVISAKPDAQAALHYNAYYYVRYQQKLYRIPKNIYLNIKNQTVEEDEVYFVLGESIQLSSGQFHIQPAEMGLSLALLGQKLTLLPRKGGEKIHLYGRVGHWPLKKAIQESQILPWLRHTIQILCLDNVMLGVFTPNGFWLAQSDYCVALGWLPHLSSESFTM